MIAEMTEKKGTKPMNDGERILDEAIKAHDKAVQKVQLEITIKMLELMLREDE
jgi:hypothetical protein